MSISKDNGTDAAQDVAPVPAPSYSDVPEPVSTPVDLESNDQNAAQDVAPVPAPSYSDVPEPVSTPVDLESNDQKPPQAAAPRAADSLLSSWEPSNSAEKSYRSSSPRFSKRQLVNAIILLVSICIIIAAITLPVTMKGSKKKKKKAPTRLTPSDRYKYCSDRPSTNKPVPTNANPPLACTINNKELMSLSVRLFGYHVCPCTKQMICCTPEEKTLAWMMNDTFNSTLVADEGVSDNNRKDRVGERFALVHLHYQTRLDRPFSYSYLSSSDHCDMAYNTTFNEKTFPFVKKCDSDNRVDAVHLTSFFNYPGVTIPATIRAFSKIRHLYLEGKFVGTIPSSIIRLQKLETLILNSSRNKIIIPGYPGGLTGAVPTEIGNLVSLKSLDLSLNSLTAKLPTEIGKLASLESIRLDYNKFADPFPVEVNQLSNLKSVDLSGNPLSSVPYEIQAMDGLESLTMRHCFLTGSLSDIDFPSSLRKLFLDENQLSGTIPTEIGLLTNLDSLYVNDNQIKGPLPLELFGLVNLEYLLLSKNPLNTSIPTEIGNLTKLNALIADECSLTGVIPTEVALLTGLNERIEDTSDKYLHGLLSLNDNALTGSIPPLLGREVSLNNNKLSGPILPELLESLSNTDSLDAQNNELEGQIPTEIGLLTKMNDLRLSGNNLDGTIPTEIGLLSVHNLSLDNNANLSGPIPTEIGTMPNIKTLRLNDCSLTGSIPTEFGLFPLHFTGLQLQNNQLTGNIPIELNTPRPSKAVQPFDISGNLFNEMALADICKSTETSVFGNRVRGSDLPTFIAECNICNNAPASPCCEESCV